MGVQPHSAVDEVIRRIAARLRDEDFEQLLEAMNLAALEANPDFGTDVTLAVEAAASNRANAIALLDRARADPAAATPTEPPPEAIDVARTLVRRGLDLGPLLGAYRRAQNVAWQHWMAKASEEAASREELVAVLERSSALLFGYVDTVLARILDRVQQEREELLGGALARRRETVRLLLDGAPLDTGRANTHLGYDLDRRHLALVVWAAGGEAPQGALESTALAVARAAGSARPLTLDAGAAALWAWCAVSGDLDVAALRAAAEDAPSGVHVATGTVEEGPLGFRLSHEAALEVQRLVAESAATAEREPALVAFRDVEPVVLATRDEDRAGRFVATTLGALGADDEQTAMLRETVRTHLAEGGNAPRAAERLHVHRNTVLQRVARAEELLGRDVTEDRLGLALALEIAHWRGGVISGSGRPARRAR